EHGLAVVGPHEALYGMLGTVYAWSPISGGGDEVTTLREAEACARRAFALNPDSAQGLSIMGQVAYRRGRAAEAVRLLSRACAAIPRVVAGRDAEAASHFQWLERQQPDDPLASVAVRFWRGLAGDRAAVLSPPSAAERATAESDEYWAYLMAGAYALVGEADQALSWLEHAIKVRGWIDY